MIIINEKKECANVIMVFSVSESGRFSGYARLSSESDRDSSKQVNWVLPPMLSVRSLSGLFKIDWITKYIKINLKYIYFYFKSTLSLSLSFMLFISCFCADITPIFRSSHPRKKEYLLFKLISSSKTTCLIY